MNLNFRVFGAKGEPLILLHGLFGSLDNWVGVARDLSSHFRVFAVDQRNHGGSPHVPDMDYPAMAGDLFDFMRLQRLEQCHLLGHSMGGKTAMEAALLDPGRVRKLVVVDIAPRTYASDLRPILDALKALNLDDFSKRSEVEAALAIPIPDLAARRFLVKNIGYEHGRLQWKLNLDGIAANYDRLSAGLRPGRSFSSPALFLVAENSDYVRPGDELLIRQLFSSGRIKRIHGAGHWLHIEASRLFKHEVLSFLLSPES
jgi:esterase